MGGHRFAAITQTGTQHVGTDQACDTRVDVYNRTTCEVQRTFVEQVATAAPNHVGNGQIGKREPEYAESQHRGKLHALCKRADDQGASNACKRRLECDEYVLGNLHVIGEGVRQ